MEWAQYQVTEDNMKPLRESYYCTAIPYLVVFSAEGNILYAGSDAGAVDAVLKEII